MHIALLPLSAAAAGAVLMAAPAGAVQGPPPSAGDGVVRVAPAVVDRGGSVALTVTGCPGRTGRAYSPAFAAPAELAAAPGAPLRAEARIRPTATLGLHEVRIACATTGSPVDPDGAARADRGLLTTFRVLDEGAGDRARTGDLAPSQSGADDGAQGARHAAHPASSAPGEQQRRAPGEKQGAAHGEKQTSATGEEQTSAPAEQQGAAAPEATGAAPSASPGPRPPGAAAPEMAAQPELAGPGTRHTVTGLALASVAAVAMAVRSTRRRAARTGGKPRG
ncbi:hypothetical protein [Streptomyces sp. SCSIO ZS0520]|uniref:hypothetical protein n=1 Tax=Streptomyces sp. SCSIO ZS0520 TaxID=2892996 RepID=UPI0021D92D13|nr:hypothetical protein [Streptomyces sp. SCSIO ZS0520]